MTRNLATVAIRCFVTSTLIALALAAALPQVGLAATWDAGIWKVNPARSKSGAGWATLVINRVEGGNSTTGQFIAISNGNIYSITREAVGDRTGVKPVEYINMKDRSAALIGTKVRSSGHCDFSCQKGLPDPRRTLTFKPVDGAEAQIAEMLASDGQNK